MNKGLIGFNSTWYLFFWLQLFQDFIELGLEMTQKKKKKFVI